MECMLIVFLGDLLRKMLWGHQRGLARGIYGDKGGFLLRILKALKTHSRPTQLSHLSRGPLYLGHRLLRCLYKWGDTRIPHFPNVFSPIYKLPCEFLREVSYLFSDLESLRTHNTIQLWPQKQKEHQSVKWRLDSPET